MVGRTRKVVNAVHRIVTLVNFLTCLGNSSNTRQRTTGISTGLERQERTPST